MCWVNVDKMVNTLLLLKYSDWIWCLCLFSLNVHERQHLGLDLILFEYSLANTFISQSPVLMFWVNFHHRINDGLTTVSRIFIIWQSDVYWCVLCMNIHKSASGFWSRFNVWIFFHQYLHIMFMYVVNHHNIITRVSNFCPFSENYAIT